jgi:hypothetical protein
MNDYQQPQETDLVLGSDSPPPATGAVLGGITGLRYKLAAASPDLKVDLLPQSQNYGDAGIDLLIEYAADSALIVRAKAGQLLQNLPSPKARSAIANGLLINPSDIVFEVYESELVYNDSNYFIPSYEECETYGYEMRLVSQHVSESSAEKSARLHHQWRSIQEKECIYFPIVIRGNFDIVDWCQHHRVLIRLPRESQSDFVAKLDAAGYSTDLTNRLAEENQAIYQEFSREDIDETDEWLWGVLATRAIALLQASQQYELLAQLWLDAAGQLAFVRQTTITAPTYIKITENL